MGKEGLPHNGILIEDILSRDPHELLLALIEDRKMSLVLSKHSTSQYYSHSEEQFARACMLEQQEKLTNMGLETLALI